MYLDAGVYTEEYGRVAALFEGSSSHRTVVGSLLRPDALGDKRPSGRGSATFWNTIFRCCMGACVHVYVWHDNDDDDVLSPRQAEAARMLFCPKHADEALWRRYCVSCKRGGHLLIRAGDAIQVSSSLTEGAERDPDQW